MPLSQIFGCKHCKGCAGNKIADDNCIKVAFVGNPNVGKTSLYNSITRSNARVGNWHGVTVGVVKKVVEIEDCQIEFVDLPGIYSLESFSKDEELAVERLNQGFDLIVYVINGTQVQKNIYLLMQLKQKYDNILIAINFCDQIQKQKIDIDISKLETIFGKKCVSCSALKKSLTKPLVDAIIEECKPLQAVKKADAVAKDDVKQENKQTAVGTGQNCSACKALTQGDCTVQQTAIQQKVRSTIEQIDQIYKPTPKLGRLDKIVLNKYLALPIFFLVIAAIFLLVFSVIGNYSASFIDNVIVLGLNDLVGGAMSQGNAPEWIISLVIDCLINGVFGIIKFMPGIIALYFFLTILEDSGYIARVAFVTDELFSKFGLSGRSIFTLLLGFGCNAQALCTARNCESKQIQKKVILMTPFVPCSARLPVFVFFASVMFANSGIIIFALYAIGVFLTVAFSGVLQMFKGLKTDAPTVIMELPQYQRPRAKRLAQVLQTHALSFLIRIGTMLITLNTIMWVLSNFSATFSYVPASGDTSIMQMIAGAIAPIFAPLGFDNWRAVAALIGGIIAKELVVTSMMTLGGVSAIIGTSKIVAFSYLLFVLIYTPCVAALVAISKEIGQKFAWLSLLINNGIAYLVALFFVGMSSLYAINAPVSIILLVFVVIATIAVPKIVIKIQDTKTKN